MTEIRWRQRFQNFELAYHNLAEIVHQKTLNKFEEAGLIQIFEMAFELAWKVMKDKLNYEGFDAKTPREVIKQAFVANYIQHPEAWLDILDQRNLLAHTYDKARAAEAVRLIREDYFKNLQAFYLFFKPQAR